MVNDVIMKGMLKMLKNFVTPEQIKEAASGLIKSGIDFKNSIPLDADKGETAATAIFYEVNKVVYFAIAILNDENQILRFESVKLLDELIENLLKKL
jgi:hypothetical protein